MFEDEISAIAEYAGTLLVPGVATAQVRLFTRELRLLWQMQGDRLSEKQCQEVMLGKRVIPIQLEKGAGTPIDSALQRARLEPDTLCVQSGKVAVIKYGCVVLRAGSTDKGQVIYPAHMQTILTAIEQALAAAPSHCIVMQTPDQVQRVWIEQAYQQWVYTVEQRAAPDHAWMFLDRAARSKDRLDELLADAHKKGYHFALDPTTMWSRGYARVR